jgi:hypothetical protein
MTKKLFIPKKEDICPNCGTACLATDVSCPNCKKNLDELFEQLPIEEFETKPFLNIPKDYNLLLKWILATTIGFVLGEVYLTSLTFRFVPLTLLESKFDWFGIMLGVAAGIATGFSVGVFQWLILRKYFTHNWLWILATLIGITGGNFIEGLIIVVARDATLAHLITGYWVIIPLIALFIAGLEIGSIQSVILHKFLSKTWTWVITVGFSWTLAVTVGNDVIHPMFYPVLDFALIQYAINPLAEIIIHGTSGILFGFFTGVLLLRLFKQNHIMIQNAA